MNRNPRDARLGLTPIDIFLIGLFFLMLSSCSRTEILPIECLSDYISLNIEEEKIRNFVKSEGLMIYREGWGNLTAKIAEDRFLIDQCNLPEYLALFDLSLNDKKGKMMMMYSVHSYLKTGTIELEAIAHKVDSLYFLENNSLLHHLEYNE